MNIIIAGDGKVGGTLTRLLSAEGHDITLIDTSSQVLEASLERYDVMAVNGNCASMHVLRQAGVKDADLLIAASGADEVNLLCCTTAHGMNPNLHTIARIRNPEYTEQIYGMRDIFGLSMVINPEKQAATEIEQLLKFPGFLGRDSFAKGRSQIVELKIDKNSKLLNVRLVDMMSIIKCRVLICAVQRGGNTVVPNSGDFTFREGDRVMQIRNNYDIMWKKRDGGAVGTGIFKGDVGTIAAIDPHMETVTVVFDDREAEYDFSMLNELEPAYAMTVHKSQGSEYRAVILSAWNGSPYLLSRSILYTAITRARELLIIVGREQTVAAMTENAKVGRRYSGLKLRLQGKTV